MKTRSPRTPRRLGWITVGLLAGLFAVSTAQAGIVDVGGDDSLVSVGDGELLSGGSAQASVAPSTVHPGEPVTVTYEADTGLLHLDADHDLSCTLVGPDGREASFCSSASTALEVRLLGASDTSRSWTLVAPDQPGDYTVEIQADGALGTSAGSQEAQATFEIEPQPAQQRSAGADERPEASQARAAPHEDAFQPADVGPWLIDHPWALVVLAAVGSLLVFRWAARASPSRP